LLSIRLDIEVGKEHEKDDGVKTNPVSKHHWIVTVGVEEELRRVNGDEQKLRLKQTRHSK